MSGALGPTIDEGRIRILELVGPADDVTFLRGYGNVGDDLIHAGTRQLLCGVRYREVSVRDLDGLSGELALLSGSGAWCGTYHEMPTHLLAAEERFARVIVLPSSFDVAAEPVAAALRRTTAKVMARERASFEMIRDMCDAELAHDTAFYFDYRPYLRAGNGTLHAFRLDGEASGRRLPAGNDDISLTCENLDEFLWTIARHERVRTDRAHVMIAAAMLGKSVEYGSSNYHKVPGIAEFSLAEHEVTPLRPGEDLDGHDVLDASGPGAGHDFRHRREDARRSHATWAAKQSRTREEIESIVPVGATVILVDDDAWGREPLARGRVVLPFLERDGSYWGPPQDDADGIAEVERMRRSGASFIAFVEPAFWWLDSYLGLHEHLLSNARLVFANDRLVAFDLRP